MSIIETVVNTPPSTLNSDYPSCVFWAQLQESTGSALADKTGNITDLAVVKSGTGDPWVNFAANGTFKGSTSVGNEAFGTSGSAMVALLTDIDAQSVIMEVDFQLAALEQEYIFSIGYQDSNTKGIAIRTHATGKFQFNTAGSGGNSISIQTSDELTQINERAHACFVWNRSVADTQGVVSLYFNGVFVEDKILPSDPGNIFVTTGGRMSVAGRATLEESNAEVYNARMWYLTTPPANIALVVQQMAQNPDEYPSLMKDVV